MKAANGQPSADEIIDPQADQDETAPALDPQTSKPEPQVIDSRPKNGAENLAECKLIGILFNQPLDVTPVSASTVVLSDGANAIPARLVPSAEGWLFRRRRTLFRDASERHSGIAPNTHRSEATLAL
jgi:hypothetical protein